ncbi:MAG: hypothetical protein JNJ90_17965 [Saprospiraceae bacterium]|jgi:hypothetical protein|nr:hypothetical protein [Saprospiraceae bacterium]
MTKKFMLTAVAVLFSALVALAQTEPQTQPVPAGKTEKMEKKDKTDKIQNAEQRSNGAAFSGKGKGGDKDQVEKGDKTKDKAKAKKDKKKRKDKVKKAKKNKKQGDNNSDSDTDTGNKEDKAPSDKWEQKPGSNEKTPGTRQPGDKPADGTEMKKERKSRG